MTETLRPSIRIGLAERAELASVRDGSIPIPGFSVKWESGAVNTFQAMAKNPPIDGGELPFATFLQAIDHGTPILGIPVFTTRYFEHNQTTVGAASGIRDVHELE